MFSVREDLAESDVTPEQAGTYYWNWITLHETLSEDDMREFADHFNWRKISDHQKGLTESFIRENQERVHWDRICQRIRMSEDFIDEFQDKMVWDYVWSYQKKLSCNFIEKHLKGHGRVDWGRIAMYQKLDEKFIFNHADELNFITVLEYQKPKRELFEKIYAYGKNKFYGNKAELKDFERQALYIKIQRFKNLPIEEILRYTEVRERFCWYTILDHQNLDEEFLEKNYKKIKKDDALWNLFGCQKLSEEFLKKHEKDLKDEKKNYWHAIMRNSKIKRTEWIINNIKKQGS